MSQNIQKILECGICYMNYNHKERTPKNLACGHTFCRSCLGDILQHCTKLKCPTCREETTKPYSLDNLTTNFVMTSLIDSLCQTCKNQLWTKQCTHCDKNLCGVCEEQHIASMKTVQGVKQILQLKLNRAKATIDEKSIDQIKHKSKSILEQVNIQYDKYVNMIEEDRRSKIRSIGEKMDQNESQLKPWLEQVSKLVSRAEQVLETQLGSDILSAVGGYKAICEEVGSSLDESIRKKPAITEVEYVLPRDGFRPSLMYTGNLVYTKRCVDDVDGQIYPNYYQSTWSKILCTPGNKPGQFGKITGLAICPETEKIFIVDASNHRIQVFSKNLQFMFEFGKKGVNDDEFDEPFGITLSRDKLFITDNGVIKVTDHQGRFLYSFSCLDKYMTNGAQGIAIYEDNLYVTDYFQNKIHVITTKGTYRRQFGCDIPSQITGDLKSVSVSRHGRLVASDSDGNIYIFDAKETLLKRVESNTTPEYFAACSVTFDNYGNILICDKNGNIRIMTNYGIVTHTIGSAPEYFALSSAISLNANGRSVIVGRGCELKELQVNFPAAQTNLFQYMDKDACHYRDIDYSIPSHSALPDEDWDL